MGRWSGKSCRLSTMIVMTAGFFLVEIIVGYVTNSVALVADSFHMISDVLALFIGLFSVKISKWKTKRNTYGWQRAEVLGALINSVFLMALCFSIVAESLKRMFNVEKVEDPFMLLVVGGLGLLVNLIGLCMFKGHGHSHGGVSHGHSHGGGNHAHSNGDSHAHSHGGGNHAHSNGDSHAHSHGANHAHSHSHSGGDGHTTHDHNDITTTSHLNDAKAMANGENQCLMPAGAAPGADVKAMDNGNADNYRVSNISGSVGVLGKDDGSKSEINNNSVVEIDMESMPSAGNMNMRGVFLHVLGDALGSVVVLISGTAIWLGEGDWKYYLDPALSITIVAIIMYTTIPLLKDTAYILLQTVPRDVNIEQVLKEIKLIDGVTGVHDCHIWQLSGGKNIASVHFRCDDLSESVPLADHIRDVFNRHGIHNTTIQPDVKKVEEKAQEHC